MSPGITGTEGTETKMATKNTKVSAAQAQAAEPVEADQVVETSATQEDTVSGEIVTAPTAQTTAIARSDDREDDGRTLLHLVPLLPHKAHRLKKFVRASDDDFGNAYSALDPASQDAVDELLARMSGDKMGIEDDSKGFRPMTLKIRQGANNDANCPELCDVGGIYTSDGRVLTAPTELLAKKGGVPLSQRLIVLASWHGRVMFAPRVNGVVTPLPEFGDASTNIPYCQSMDRQKGRPVKNVPNVGTCKGCPYEPWKVRGEPNLCTNQVSAVILLVRTDSNGNIIVFDGLYQVDFSKTSEPAGQNLHEAVAKGKYAWEFMAELMTKKVAGKPGQSDYYVYETKLVTDGSGRPLKTPDANLPMLEVFWKKLMAEYFYPRLGFIYSPVTDRTGGPSGPTSDMSDLERNAANAARAQGADMRSDNV